MQSVLAGEEEKEEEEEEGGEEKEGEEEEEEAGSREGWERKREGEKRGEKSIAMYANSHQ